MPSIRRIAYFFGPDSQFIATGSAGRSLQVLNLSTRRPAWRFARAHADGILALAFSPDGKRLVTSSHDQTVKVWDSATGQEILTLRGHASRIVGVVFDADGHCLLSASADGNIRIWDATPLESKPGQMARVADK